MTVISDTTCLSTLARIGKLDLLRDLFGEVILPAKVLEELLELYHFGVDVTLFTQLKWLVVENPSPSLLLKQLLEMNKIDPGEGYATALAVELQADWIILDDLGARKVATDLGLKVTGLGGILLQAKAVGSIGSVKEYLDLCVEKANFRLTREVYNRLLQLAEEE